MSTPTKNSTSTTSSRIQSSDPSKRKSISSTSNEEQYGDKRQSTSRDANGPIGTDTIADPPQNATRRYQGPQKMVDGQLHNINTDNYINPGSVPAYQTHWEQQQQQQQQQQQEPRPPHPGFQPWQFPYEYNKYSR
ncbi:hypothetical protein BJX99DRAFT_260747 [Aspergillus californicus]